MVKIVNSEHLLLSGIVQSALHDELLKSFSQSHEVGAVIIHILQMKK